MNPNQPAQDSILTVAQGSYPAPDSESECAPKGDALTMELLLRCLAAGSAGTSAFWSLKCWLG